MDNLGGSLQGINLDPRKIATNIVTEIAPNMTSVAVSAMDSVRDFRDFLNRSRASMNMQNKQMSQNPLVKDANDDLSDLGSYVNSGSKAMNDELNMISDNFDDIMSDFPTIDNSIITNDPADIANSNSIRGAEATTRMTAAAASATISSISKATETLAKAQMQSAAYIAKSSSSTQLIGLTKLNTQLIGVNKRLDVLNSNVVKILQFNNENVSLTNQRMLQYMNNSEEMLKALTATYANTPGKKVRQKDSFGVLDYGYIDGAAIKDHIKRNMDNSIFGVAGMLKDMMKTTLFGDGLLPNAGRSSANKILETVTSGIVEQYVKELLLPAGLVKSVSKLDKNLFSYMRQGMLALGDQRSTNPIIGLLGDLLGVKSTARNVKLDKYSKDAMPWNGVSQKYLTEVIPGYLASIEKGVLGLSEARYFDPAKGRFYTESEAKAAMKKSRGGDVYNFDRAVKQLTDALASSENAGADTRKITDDLNRLINARLKSDQNTDPQFAANIEQALQGIFNPAQMKDFIMEIEDSIYESRKRETRRMNDVENNLEGSIYRQLLMNGGKYKDLMGDLDIFKNADFDRFGRRARTPLDDEDDLELKQYERAKQLANIFENPAKRGLNRVGQKINPLRTKWNNFVSGNRIASTFLPTIPEFENMAYRPAEFSRAYNGPANRVDEADMMLYQMAYNGQMPTREQLTGMRDAVTSRLPGRRSRLDRRNATASATVNFEDAERMSESQRNQAEATISREMQTLTDTSESSGATGVDALIESQQAQTRAVIAANENSHKIFTLNLGKVFGKDGRIAKLFQSESFQKAKTRISKYLFGEKGADRVYRDGLFSAATNKLLDVGDYFKYVFNGEAYTDRAGKKHAATDNAVFKFFKRGFDNVFSSTMTHIFGEDYKNNESYQKYFSWMDRRKEKKKTKDSATPVVDIDKNGNVEITGANATVDALVGNQGESVEKKQQTFLDTFKKRLPKTLAMGIAGAAVPLLAGGNMGALGSMFLPGGPVGGAIVGLGLGILTQSDTFQKIVFGEKNQDGKRVGGLINEKMRATMKKIAPAAIGGASVALLKSVVTGGSSGPMGLLFGSLLPGGIIGTALFGAGMGILTKSEKFNKILFGDNENDDSGLKNKIGKKISGITAGLGKSKDFIGGGLKGAAAGAITGAMLSQMGVLGSALSIGGPVGFGLAGLGLGIASQTDRFKKYFWGDEEVDENGNPTGKRKNNGLVGKFQNFMQIEVFDKIATKAEETTTDLAYWTKGAILSPINKAFGPLVNGVQDIKEDISDAIRSAFTSVANTITEHVKNGIDKFLAPIGNFLLTKLIKPAANTSLNVVKGAGKAATAVAMAPVNLMTLGTRKKRDATNEQFQADLLSGKVEGFTGGDLTPEEMIAAKKAWAKENAPDRNMSWMWQDDQNKLDREKARQAKATFKQNRKYDKLRTRFLQADKYSEYADIDLRTFEMRKKQLATAGYDVSNMNTADDLRAFMFKKDTTGATALPPAMQEAEKKQEARDNRDKAYQEQVVDLLKDQLAVSTGGRYDNIKGPVGKPLRDKDAQELSIGGILASQSEAQAKAQAAEAKKEKETQESIDARSLTAENIKKSKESNATAVTVKDKIKNAGNTVKSTASGLLDWVLNNPSQAVGGALALAVVGPMIGTMAKEFWTDTALPYLKENGPKFAANAVGAIGSAAKWGFGELAKGVTTIFTNLPRDILGVVQGIFGSNEQVAAVDESGNIMYNADGSVATTNMAANTDLLGSMGRFGAGWATVYNKSTISKFVKGTATGVWGALKGVGDSYLKGGLIRGTIGALPKAVIGAASELKASAAKTAAKADLSDLKEMDVDSLIKKTKTVFEGIFNKIKESKILEKLASNTVVDKISKNVLSAIDTLFGAPAAVKKRILEKLPPALLSFFGRTAGFVLKAGFALWDVGTGALEAESIFNIDSENCTSTMRRAAAICKAITGFFGVTALLDVVFELVAAAKGTRNNAKREFATAIYNAIVLGDEEEIQALKDAQMEYDEKAQAWVDATGKELSDYDNLRKQTAWDKVSSTASNVVNKVKTTTSNIISNVKTVESLNLNNMKSAVSYLFGKSTGSGIGYGAVPQMSQYDPRWANMPIGLNNGQPYTMGSGGCGPTSLAMVANSMGRGVTPGQVGAMARDEGYAVSGGSSKYLFTEGASKLGLKSSSVGSSGIAGELAKGNPVILSGKGSGNDGTPYTKVGHIVTASGMDTNGNVIVNDPRYNTPTKYPLSKVKQGMTHGWSYSEGSGDDPLKNSDAVYYQQFDSRWSKVPYGSKTIGTIGCIMTSLAMALSSLTGQTITPQTVVNKWGNKNWVKGAGTSWNIMGEAASDTGLDVKKSLSADEIMNAAYQRKPVVMWGKKGPGSIFGNGGSASQGFHSVIAINADPNTGRIMFNDPGKAKGQNLLIDKSAITGNIKQGYIFSKGGKGIGDIDPSAIANGTPVDYGVSSNGATATSTGTTDTSSSSGWSSPLSNALSKMAGIAGSEYDKALTGTSVGSGDITSSSSALSSLSSALGQMANIASADLYSNLMGVSYQEAKAAISNGGTAGTDDNDQYNPNAPTNSSYTKWGAAESAIINKDLRKFSPVSEADMNGWFKRANSSSPFNGNGKVFIDAGNATGIDPRYLAAHAALESGWGTSAICKEKGNYFGIGAYDRSPYASAYSFEPGLKTGISGGADWISKHYINNGYETLAKMKARGYATDQEWPYKIASIMKNGPADTTSVGSGLGIADMYGRKYGTDQQNRVNQLNNKLNLALNTDGLESKLNTLIEVAKDILGVTKDSQSNMTVNVDGGDTNINMNGKSKSSKSSSKSGNTYVINNQKDKSSTLRGIHEMIARTTATPA